MRKKIQPWPWHVQYRQFDGRTGTRSRPRIIDANGKAVSFSNSRQVTLVALAPVLFDRLTKLLDRAEMLHLQIQSELGINIPRPAEITAAIEAVSVMGRI